MEHEPASTTTTTEQTPSAPSPGATPSAREALKDKDFTAYKQARHAERLKGTDSLDEHHDDQPATPSVAASEDAEPPKSKETPAAAPSAEPAPKRGEARASENRVPELLAERKRFEDEAKALRLELDALKATSPAPKSDARQVASSATAPTDDPEPDPADATKYPDGIFDRKFMQDQARWGARQEFRTQQAASETKAKAETFAKAQIGRIETFHGRLKASAEDGDTAKLVSTFSAEVNALKPFALLGEKETPTGRNAVAEEIIASEHAAAFMRHFTDQPADLTRIAALSPRELIKAMAILEEGFATPKPAKTVTDVPDTGTTLGRRPADSTDPTESALKRKDFTAYKAARHQERLAALR